MTGARWQVRIAATVATIIRERKAPFGRAYATFLERQVRALDAAFGPSTRRKRTNAPPNPYRITVGLLRSLGYSQREMATILHLSQSAVARLSRWLNEPVE